MVQHGLDWRWRQWQLGRNRRWQFRLAARKRPLDHLCGHDYALVVQPLVVGWDRIARIMPSDIAWEIKVASRGVPTQQYARFYEDCIGYILAIHPLPLEKFILGVLPA